MRRPLDVIWHGKRVWDGTQYVRIAQEHDSPEVRVRGPERTEMRLLYGARPEAVSVSDTWTVPKTSLFEGRDDVAR